MHVHFVNENIGGHATMHHHLRRALAENDEIRATFFDLPRASVARRLVGAAIPGLGRLDLDLQVLRAQLAQSAVVRRHLDGLAETPDALHAYTQNSALLSVGYMRKVPTVVSTDVTNRQNAYRIPYRRPTRFTPALVPVSMAWERRVYAQARYVVAHSTWTADAILGYGVPGVRVEVIPFGISVPPAVPPVRDGGLPRIVFVGTSMDRKGGWRLLRLWQQHLRDRTRLTLVTMEQVPPTPGVEVRNDVRPGDGKLEQILASADIFALPGEIDAFGYAVLEAMAAELPTVAPRVAAIPELVLDGVTGFVVPPGDDEAFAAAILRLADDASARHELGLAGRARVLERFDARNDHPATGRASGRRQRVSRFLERQAPLAHRDERAALGCAQAPGDEAGHAQRDSTLQAGAERLTRPHGDTPRGSTNAGRWPVEQQLFQLVPLQAGHLATFRLDQSRPFATAQVSASFGSCERAQPAAGHRGAPRAHASCMQAVLGQRLVHEPDLGPTQDQAHPELPVRRVLDGRVEATHVGEARTPYGAQAEDEVALQDRGSLVVEREPVAGAVAATDDLAVVHQVRVGRDHVELGTCKRQLRERSEPSGQEAIVRIEERDEVSRSCGGSRVLRRGFAAVRDANDANRTTETAPVRAARSSVEPSSATITS